MHLFIVVILYDCCLTFEGIWSKKKLNSQITTVPFYHNPYLWKSHQIWGFFTFLADLAFCVPGVKKDTTFGATRKIFGPSYFVTSLENLKWSCWENLQIHNNQISHWVRLNWTKTVRNKLEHLLISLEFQDSILNF